ncbi:unannotated protein [freshwater metagenome]|uniref:Unannotated protein n=1 Tax=freshwater metagenome TaxID=449393 RepID=A0A6J7B0N7_9ZZZZ
MSGYFAAIHGATYIPINPTLPFSPASKTAPRSTHSDQRPPPQSSIITSIVPASIASYVVGPSSRVVCVIVQPNSFLAISATTCADAV